MKKNAGGDEEIGLGDGCGCWWVEEREAQV
jgi:hypothetical protein